MFDPVLGLVLIALVLIGIGGVKITFGDINIYNRNKDDDKKD